MHFSVGRGKACRIERSLQVRVPFQKNRLEETLDNEASHVNCAIGSFILTAFKQILSIVIAALRYRPKLTGRQPLLAENRPVFRHAPSQAAG